MSPDREADLAVGSAVEPSDRVPTLRRGSARRRPPSAERAGEVAPHLDHGDLSLANPDAIRMRVFQGDRHPPRRVDKPMGRVCWDLDPGRELVAGCGLRLPVTTTRAAGEDKSSERCGRHRQSHPLSIRGEGPQSPGPACGSVTRRRRGVHASSPACAMVYCGSMSTTATFLGSRKRSFAAAMPFRLAKTFHG